MSKRVVTFDEDALRIAVEVSCEKHELRGQEREVVFDLIDRAVTQAAVLECVATGNMEVAGAKDGQLLFSLTDKGKSEAKRLMNGGGV